MEGIMNIKAKRHNKEMESFGVTGDTKGGKIEVELDPVDIEILLTSGHYDDCCIS
jgi:hypothetical protein